MTEGTRTPVGIPNDAPTVIVVVGAFLCMAGSAWAGGTNRPSGATSQPVAAPVTRANYQAAFARIKVGMPSSSVHEILGAPNDVRTGSDPGGISTTNTKEIWGYGTDGHLSFPTLGQVYIDTTDCVQYVVGGCGKPPVPDQFTEDELRNLLRTIHRVPSYNDQRSSGFNPLPLIQAVNALHKLGKERALAAMDEYVRVSAVGFDEGREGLFLVLRVLFEVPQDPGYMPRMYVGAPFPGEPNDPKLFPRFPIAVVEDVPFKLVSGYSLGGRPEPVERHIEYFRERGLIRGRCLRPPDNPILALRALEQLLMSAQWNSETPSAGSATPSTFSIAEDEPRCSLAREQLLELLGTVYPRHATASNARCVPWSRIAEELINLSIKWNETRAMYTIDDAGSSSGPPERGEPSQGAKARLTDERATWNEGQVPTFRARR